MNPFRDELGAAHAKIARLEEHVHHLEHGRARQPKRRFPRSMIVYLLLMIVLFVVLGAATVGSVLVVLRSGSAHPPSPSVHMDR
jgi:hypothetical protein